MKFYKRLNKFKASNFEFDCNTNEGFSYGWWKINTVYKGFQIVNKSFYSTSTVKHQQKTLRLLDYKYDLLLKHTNIGMQAPEKALKSEIRLLKLEIKELIQAIKRPRSRKATNEKRKLDIKNNLDTVYKIRSILNA